MKKIIAVLLMFVFLVGCASKPVDDEVEGIMSSTITTTTTVMTTATTTTASSITTATTTTTTTTTQKPTTTTKKSITTTTTVPAKKSWFNERGFKITPLTSDFCMNRDPEHVCPSNKSIGIVEGQTDAYGNNVNIPGKKVVHFLSLGAGESTFNVVAFDRYTGVALAHAVETELKVNDDEYSATCYIRKGLAAGVPMFEVRVNCTDNYDGIVFCVSKDIKYPGVAGCTLDELIDFDTAEYYFFSASNK